MPSAHDPGRERGFGLLLVVVLLALMGALSLGAFGAARQEFRNASDLGYAAQAFEAAESGLAAAASAAAGLGGALPFASQAGPASLGARTRVATKITRLNESLFLLTSVGERIDGGGAVLARRFLGLVGKLESGVGSAPPRFVPLDSRGWVQLFD